MKTIAEHFEQRHARARLMDRIEETKPRLAQAVAALRCKEKQAEFAARFRERKKRG